MNEFPRRFGPYILLKPLARGGMGALYIALSGPEANAKLCVIKTVLPHLADKEYLQRFRDEAKVVVYHRPRAYRATYYAGAEASASALEASVAQLAALAVAGPRFLYLWSP